MCRWICVIAITGWLVPTVCRASSDPPFLLDDVLAGMRSNASLLDHPYVAWSWRSHRGEGELESLKAQRQRWREKLARSKDPNEKLRLSELIEAQDKSVANFPSTAQSRFDFELWSNGSDIQIRSPLYESNVAAGSWRSPVGDLSPSRLLTEFKAIQILSYVNDRSPTLRVWTGVDKGRGTGLIAPRKIEQVIKFLYPLYCTPKFSVDSPVVDWASWLLSRPRNQLQIVRVEAVDGHHAIVVQHHLVDPVSFPNQRYEGEIETSVDTTFWLDIDRGLVPLKISRTAEWLYNGKRPTTRQHDPFERIAFSDIRMLKGGGYYPFSMNDAIYMDDPEFALPPNDPKKIIRGEESFPPYVLKSVESIEVGSVAPGRGITKSMADLIYPSGTVYVNGATRKPMIEGVPEQEMNRRLEEVLLPNQGVSAASEVHGLTFRGMVLLVNGVVIAILAILLGRRYWNRSDKANNA